MTPKRLFRAKNGIKFTAKVNICLLVWYNLRMDVLNRQCQQRLIEMLSASPAVLLVGARQTGKSVLARQIAALQPSVYFDLEEPGDLQALDNPGAELRRHPGKLIVIDEVQHKPDLFNVIRVIIDELRRQGNANGKFLLLGSVIEDLQRQAESLAGRIMEMQLHPFNLLEAQAVGELAAFGSWRQQHPSGHRQELLVDFLRQRGGYPESLLAGDESGARKWRQAHLRTVLSKDASQPKVAQARFLQLLKLIADKQGSVTPIQQFAHQLGMKKGATVASMLATLDQMMLIFSLPAYGNAKYQARKAAKYYICDSGILTDQLGRPAGGGGWEGFVIGNIISVLPAGWNCFYFKDARGREIDLILVQPGGAIWAIEIKSGTDLHIDRHLPRLFESLHPQRCFLVHGGSFKQRPSAAIEFRSLPDMMQEVIACDPDLRPQPTRSAPAGAGASAAYQQLMHSVATGDRMLNIRRDAFIADCIARAAVCCDQATGPSDRQARLVWAAMRDELLEWLRTESRIQPAGKQARPWQQALYTALEAIGELAPASSAGSSYNFYGDFPRLCCHDLFVHVTAVLLANSCHECILAMTTRRYRIREVMLAFICFWSGQPAEAAGLRWLTVEDEKLTVGEFIASHSRLAVAQLLAAELLLFLAGMILSEKLLADKSEGDRAQRGYFCWDPQLIKSVAALPRLEFFQRVSNREGAEALAECLGIEPSRQGIAQLKMQIDKYLHLRSKHAQVQQSDFCRALDLDNWHEFTD